MTLTLSSLGDVARAVALPVVHRRRQSHIPYLRGVDDVRALLSSPSAQRHPPYVLSVLTEYARQCSGGGKRARASLEAELGMLEAEFPEFAAEFRAVCKVRGLARTPCLGDERCRCTRHQQLQRRVATPPPVYSTDDPDPEATRVLVRQLLSAAGVSSGLSAAAQDAEEAHAAMVPSWGEPERRTWLAR